MGDAEMIGGSTAFAIVMILFFCLYACGLHKCRRRNRAIITDVDAFSDTENVPLSSDVIASLPVFVCGPMTNDDKFDCAVCISEFKEGEKLRLLPKCRHCFHTECIDVWFRSHSTCPLCRVIVDSETGNLQVV